MLRCIWLLLCFCALFPSVQAQGCSSPGMPPLRAINASVGRMVLTIEVVVHIVYRTPASNISDAQVHSQMEVLNQDFRAANSDLNLVTLPAFQQLIADVEVEFVLASHDPVGNPSSGIIRTQTDIQDIASTFDALGRRQIAYSELGGSDAWSTDCYLNIWVGEFNEGVAGLGTFPGSVDALEDGVYVAFDRFGTTGTATPPYDKGRTATHEIGHFLGLQHLWGNTAIPPADCSGNDGIADTNKQSVTYLGECPMGNRTTCGSFDMYMNFMSLADDACIVMFTEGQKAFMRNILLQERTGLVDDTASTCVVGLGEPDISPPTLISNYFFQENQLMGSLQSAKQVHLTLYKLSGQRLLVLPAQQHSFRIDMQNIPSGIYILQAQNKSIRQSVKVLYLK